MTVSSDALAKEKISQSKHFTRK